MVTVFFIFLQIFFMRFVAFGLILLISFSKAAFCQDSPAEKVNWKAFWIRDPHAHFFTDERAYQVNPAPVFSRVVSPGKTVRAARLFISALGYFEATLNGVKIGNHVLNPSQTDYKHRIFYNSYDISPLLQQPQNLLEVMVGNGWYNPMPLRLFGRFNLQEVLPVGEPSLRAQIHLEYIDGSTEIIASDTTWKVRNGSVIRNSIYLGEWIDPALSHKAADRTAVPATVPRGKMELHTSPPVIIGDTLAPVGMHRTSTGWVLDFGSNQTGVLQLVANIPAGDTIRVQYGELLYPDGRLNKMTSTTGQIKAPGRGGPGAPDTAYQEDRFIGTGKVEIYQPRFTYHGYRYAEILGLKNTPDTSSIRTLVFHADLSTAGEFECSDPRLNKLFEIAKRTFLSNLIGIQSDCPHREKLGYGGDIMATAESFIHLFDMEDFYVKTARDFADAARTDGGLTETAPFVGIADEGYGNGSGPIEWGTAHPELLWQLYQYYGNRKIVKEQYPVARNWVEFLRNKAAAGQLNTTIGDHETIAPKDIPLSVLSFYYYNVKLVAQLARVNGNKADAKNYQALADSLFRVFEKKFLLSDSGRVGIGTQSTQAHALYFNLVPEQLRQKAVDYLVKLIKERDNGHISTGIFGTKFLLEVLGSYGRADLGYDLLVKEGFPGWMHMLDNGATSLWEHWEFSDNTFSHNHPMFGTYVEFLFRWQAGIRKLSKTKAAAADYLIQPDTRRLNWVNSAVQTPNGRLAVKWVKRGNKIELTIDVPANTVVNLNLPSAKMHKGWETSRLGAGKHTVLKDLPAGW